MKRSLALSFRHCDVRTCSSLFRFSMLALASLLTLGISTNACAGKTDIVYQGDESELDKDPVSNVSKSLYPAQDNLSNNTVTVNANVPGRIYGAVTKSDATVTGNRVTVNADAGNNVYGAYSQDGNATGNMVIVNDGTTSGYVFGGYSKKGAVTKNEVIINKGATTYNIIGGSSDNGDIAENRITIHNGTIGNNVYGGYSQSSSVTGNEIIINDGTFNNGIANTFVHAGQSTFGNAVGNKVTINGGTFNNYRVSGADTATGASTGNQVTINDGELNIEVVGGSSGSSVSSENKIIINGGTINGNVYSGYTGSSASTAVHNQVIVNDGEINSNVYGGYTGGHGTKNEVVINGGTVTGDIYGAYSFTRSAVENRVTLTGGIINGNVYGGYTGNSGYSTINNIVTLAGNTDIRQATLYGGSGSDKTGNTLVIDGYVGKALNMFNFNTVSFRNLILSTDSAVFTLTQNNTKTDVNGLNINFNSVGFKGGSTALQNGAIYSLIRNDYGLTGQPGTTSLSGLQGVSLIYDLDVGVSPDEKSVDIKVASVKVNPATRTFGAARLANLEFLIQASDFALGAGLDSAVRSVESTKGIGVFGGINASDTRNDIGNRHKAKASGTHILLGAAANVSQRKDTDVIAVAYTEAGWGDMTDVNPDKDAKGDTRYFGLGLMGKIIRKEGLAKGLYGQASLQAGHTKMDFDSNLYDVAGNRATLDKGNTYYGAGAGIGFIKEINSNYSIDLLAQYKWLKLDKADVNIVGDNVSLDAVSSRRIKLGGRLNYTENKQFTLYSGLAWEHEFSYKSTGNVHGYNLENPDGAGSSGVGEAGISYNPNVNGPWSIDANVQAYVGQREGIMGKVAANYKF